jgi:hypothetical protein
MAKRCTKRLPAPLKPRTYDLDQLRKKWAVNLTNRELLQLLITGNFPRPHRVDGKYCWAESDVVTWLVGRARFASRVRWEVDRARDDNTPVQLFVRWKAGRYVPVTTKINLKRSMTK